MTNPIPDNYPRLSPYLAVDGAAAAMRLPPTNTTMPAVLMIADEWPEVGNLGPTTIGGSPVMLSIYVEDVDAVYARALAAGAESLREPEDQFYGDRMAAVRDPWGHRWSVGSHLEDVDEAEMARRMADAFGGGESS